MLKKYARFLGPVAVFLIFAVAMVLLHHELKKYHWHNIRDSLREIPRTSILWAAVLTVINYLVLVGYDALALRLLKKKLALSRIALASFVGYVSSYNFGSLLGGPSVRYRLYSTWGFSALEILQLVAICTMTFWVGFFSLASVVFLIEPLGIPRSLHVPLMSTAQPVGYFSLSLVSAYLVASLLRRKPLRVLGWEFSLPPTRWSLSQMVLGAIDLVIVASVLFVLLPRGTAHFLPFLGMYLLALLAVHFSHVPGGVAVFELVMLALLAPPEDQRPMVMASLLAYRAVYYLVPLLIAAVLFAAHEVMLQQSRLKRLSDLLEALAPELAPRFLALTTFIAGATLLFSVATPATRGRLDHLQSVEPLLAIEVAHVLVGIAGVGLLVAARGLQNRLALAWRLSVILMASSIVLLMIKGLDYEEAAVMGLMLAALLPCRRHFDRTGPVLSERLAPAWVAAIAVVLGLFVSLGAFTYKVDPHLARLHFGHELWADFGYRDELPRFLRAGAGVLLTAAVYGGIRVLMPKEPAPQMPTAGELARVRQIVEASPDDYARLALLGDKLFLFNPQRTTFIMYGIERRSWIALGDPVGQADPHDELVWHFNDLADRLGGQTVFYLVDHDRLDAYLDLGLTALKLGEEARVPLPPFSLADADTSLRCAHEELARQGCTLAVHPPGEAAAIMPDLRRVSDAWLAGSQGAEGGGQRELPHGFSLGHFDPDYLGQLPVAVVRLDGRIVAFSDLWCGANKHELAPDMVRYLPDAPFGVLDYLLAELALWGSAAGYQWLNLGLTPLAEPDNRALAPVWRYLGAMAFRHGEHLARIEDLRGAKARFHPQWRPKYLALPSGLALPSVLSDVAAVICKGTHLDALRARGLIAAGNRL